mmetsp:Transcript_61851/g.184244  ORF Transcript_61851/g.184244 Transcript_61851/m.184244 type:complete len:308 (+) Transcript_61851:297-1220(+)
MCSSNTAVLGLTDVNPRGQRFVCGEQLVLPTAGVLVRQRCEGEGLFRERVDHSVLCLVQLLALAHSRLVALVDPPAQVRGHGRQVHRREQLICSLDDRLQPLWLLLGRQVLVRVLDLLAGQQPLPQEGEVLGLGREQRGEQLGVPVLRGPLAQGLEVLDLHVAHGVLQLLRVRPRVLLLLLLLLLLRLRRRDGKLDGEAAAALLALGRKARLPVGGLAEEEVSGLGKVGKLLVHGHGEEDGPPLAAPDVHRLEVALPQDCAVVVGVGLHRNLLLQLPVHTQRQTLHALQERRVVVPQLQPGHVVALL